MAQEQPREVMILNQIQNMANGMTGWLKFLGIVNIVSGALTVLSIWGIIIAWLPIWLGVLLLQAANKITSARVTTNKGELVQMMDKLRMYFLIQGVLIIVSIVLGLIALIFLGGLIMKYLSGGGFESFQ